MKTPLLLSPSPVRALSTPALCITFGLFFKASVRKRGYNVQAQPQVSLIYKEPPVLKVSPLRAQETECRHEVGQISPGVCHWPGLREPAQLSYLGCREHPTKAGALCGQRLHTSGDTPKAVCGHPQRPQPPGDASDDPCFRDATDGLSARLFSGGVCFCFALLLVSGSCLPPLQMPWVRALCPSMRHCVSGDIPGDAESTRNYGHQAALLARESAAPPSPVPPALPLLGSGTEETETARSREEALQM